MRSIRELGLNLAAELINKYVDFYPDRSEFGSLEIAESCKIKQSVVIQVLKQAGYQRKLIKGEKKYIKTSAGNPVIDI